MDVCNGHVWNQNLRFHPENIEEENWKRTLLRIVCVSDVCIESQVFQITIICGLLLLKIFIFRGTRFENWALFHYGVRKHNNKSISHLGIIPDFQKRTEVVRDIFAMIYLFKSFRLYFFCIILTMTTTTVKEKMMYPGINVIRNSKRHQWYNFQIYERLFKVCFYVLLNGL